MRGSDSRAGDVEARFQRLFTEHYRHILAYALRRVVQGVDAQDVVADTFTVAWRRIHQAPPDELELAWLYGIAGRVLSNQRRSHRRFGALLSRLRAATASRDEEAPGSAELHDVVAAIQRLRPNDQEVLRLAAWEGLTGRELAAALRCSENAAAIRLHRARQRLVRQLAKEIASAEHSVDAKVVESQEVSR